MERELNQVKYEGTDIIITNVEWALLYINNNDTLILSVVLPS